MHRKNTADKKNNGRMATMIIGLVILAAVIALLFGNHFFNLETSPRELDKTIDEGIALCEKGDIHAGLIILRQASTAAKLLKAKHTLGYAQLNIGGYMLRALENEFAKDEMLAAVKGIDFTYPKDRLLEIKPHLLVALETEVEPPIVNFLLGRIFRELGQNLTAIRHFHKALENNQAFAQAHNDLGLTHFSLGDYEQAIDHFNQAISIDNELASGHFNLGMYYFLRNKGEASGRTAGKAITHLKRFLSLTKTGEEETADRVRANKVIKGLNTPQSEGESIR